MEDIFTRCPEHPEASLAWDDLVGVFYCSHCGAISCEISAAQPKASPVHFVRITQRNIALGLQG